MKLIGATLIFVGCLVTSIRVFAQTPQNVWMLTKGGGEKRAWWGLVKLRSFQERDYSRYHGTLTINIVLLGTFNETANKIAISVDEKLVEPNQEIDIEISKSQSLEQIVEYLTQELFAHSEVQFVVKLPLEYASSTGSVTFINDPTCIEIVPGHRDLPSLQKLQRQITENVDALVGRKIIYAKVKTSGMDAIASKIQMALQVFMPHVTIHYSNKLNTLFFSMPETESEEFAGLFRQILTLPKNKGIKGTEMFSLPKAASE